MAITWADILTWTTGPLESAATDLAATSKALVSAASEGQDATNGIQSQGSAVTAIRTAASTNMTSLAQLATNVNSALMAIEGAYDGVAKVMANVQNAQAYAAENYCTIGSDGKVSSNAYNEDEETKQRAFLAADSLQKTVNQIIKDADQVDTDLYHAMSDINNDRATDGDKATDNKVIGVPDHPNKNWTPSQNAAWWSSLSEKQRQHLIDHCPDEIRHLDGLPAAARDQANRHALKGWVDANGDEHKGALEYARGKLKEARDKSASEEEIEQLKEKVSDLEAIDRQINNDDRARKGLAPAYLLDFDYDEKYHRTTAIVSSGNPDTASYVSTLVPGIGTHVGSDLKKYMDDNENLKAQTAHTGVDPSRVATISYLGYVAPEGPGC